MWRVEETAAHFADPQPGDRFTEMYSFWMYVIRRSEDDEITVHKASAPCTFPDDAKEITYPSIEAFQAAYRYQHIDGYWMYYVDNTDYRGE